MGNYILKVNMLEGEYWYGAFAFDGQLMPFSAKTSYQKSMDPNSTNNQAVPFLVSNKGRYIWCDKGINIDINNGLITITSTKAEPVLYSGFKNMKGAYLAASKKHFPASGEMPPAEFFTGPQFCSWIEFTYYQTEEGILEYANKIIETGMPAKILMIDDGWQEGLGKWDFHPARFKDPKGMVEKLHKLGFKVMLWSCPFISADSIEYRYLRDNKYLVFDKSGRPAMKEWWEGFSAVLDFTNPGAVSWYVEQNQKLIDKYNVDGFKLDAGDAYFYSDDDVTYAPTDANGQSELWARLGLENYAYHEFRACYKCGGEGLVQRLQDKAHSWDGTNGMNTIVPAMLALGIIGHPYSCPDMIGGGEHQNFSENIDKLDFELFVRYAQISALMPMMQFSAAPWRCLDNYHFELCKKAALLHTEFSDYILKCAEQSKNSGEPIVRYMDYMFPGQGFEQITDQFMLGEDLLIAPVIKKGAKERKIVFPKGKWLGDDGSTVEGGCGISVNSPLERLPFYRRADK